MWRYKRRLTDRFVDGRVIYLGDAAHQVPPFGARGGNSGVADADNLGWKLALVVNGHAGPGLVESYHSERYAAAIENIEVTNRSALFLAPDTFARRLFRDAVLDLARRFPEVRPMVNTGRLAVAQSYPASPLNVGGSLEWKRWGATRISVREWPGKAGGWHDERTFWNYWTVRSLRFTFWRTTPNRRSKLRRHHLPRRGASQLCHFTEPPRPSASSAHRPGWQSLQGLRSG